jgi:DNA-binding XRE family transcriptional regulator
MHNGAADRRTSRTGIPALPFCHVKIQAQKPLPATFPREFKTLGDQLRKRRLELGLLQREVADRLGVDETTVYNWERNRTAPASRWFPKIFTFLDKL